MGQALDFAWNDGPNLGLLIVSFRRHGLGLGLEMKLEEEKP